MIISINSSKLLQKFHSLKPLILEGLKVTAVAVTLKHPHVLVHTRAVKLHEVISQQITYPQPVP